MASVACSIDIYGAKFDLLTPFRAIYYKDVVTLDTQRRKYILPFIIHRPLTLGTQRFKYILGLSIKVSFSIVYGFLPKGSIQLRKGVNPAAF